MCHEGLIAVTRHVHGTSFDDDAWELYDVIVETSKCVNHAEERLDVLRALTHRWWRGAEIFGVLPLDDRSIELFAPRLRDDSPRLLRRHYTYFPPVGPISTKAAAGIGGRSWDLSALIVRRAGQDVVIMATGNENAGVSVFVPDDYLVFDYNLSGEDHDLVSSEPVREGRCVLDVSFRRGTQEADVTLLLDGRDVGSLHLPSLMHIISSTGMSIDRDHDSSVSMRYHDVRL